MAIERLKIKMLTNFQGNHEGQTVPLLAEKKQFYADELPTGLAEWLIAVNKAVPVEEEKKHFGSQPFTYEPPELAHDDVLSEKVQEVVDFEPLMTSENAFNLEEIDATSSALRLAEETGVDLSEVKGTGKNGKIIQGDVLKYLEEQNG